MYICEFYTKNVLFMCFMGKFINLSIMLFLIRKVYVSGVRNEIITNTPNYKWLVLPRVFCGFVLFHHNRP